MYLYFAPCSTAMGKLKLATPTTISQELAAWPAYFVIEKELYVWARIEKSGDAKLPIISLFDPAGIMLHDFKY